MHRSIKRLIVALIISTSCFAGTVIWFNAGKNVHVNSNIKPVARLNDSSNEVQRKPLKRVIWESVNRNDELYPGEAVRTAPNAEAKLFFIKSGTIVHLEPDSLVVLEQTDKGLSLDFLQGNLFVQSSGSDKSNPTDGLTLKTGSGEIKLNSADLSLSKNKNGNINLEVHRGEAELAQGSKTTSLNKDKSAVLSENGISVSNDRLQLLSPQAGETLYLNLVRGEKLKLAWKPLPPGYNVSIELGQQRASMITMPGLTPKGEEGTAGFTHKPGQWYLRLVAKSDDPKLLPLSSTVVPFSVEAKTPPLLIEPKKNAVILKPTTDAVTDFKWVNRHKFSSQVLDISSDPRFRTVTTRENYGSDVTSYTGNLKDGTYYWRVTGFLKINGKSESLSSPIEKFVVESKYEITPPKLLAPANKMRLSFLDAQKKGVTFKWEKATGVESYRMTLERLSGTDWQPVQDPKVENLYTRVDSLKPGIYRWKVASIDPRTETEKTSETFSFNIEDMIKIEWVETNPANLIEYKTPTPILTARWKPLATPPTTYRYKFALESATLDDAQWFTTRQEIFDRPVPTDGKYQMIVEALNDKGQMVASSNLQTIELKKAPLLPAPQWASTTPTIIKGDSKGNLSFTWEQVDGAKAYLMVLESPDGKVVQEKEISRTSASIGRLKPGEYTVRMKSVDNFKRPGLDGTPRKIEVPNSSDIKAPIIKAMKVK